MRQPFSRVVDTALTLRINWNCDRFVICKCHGPGQWPRVFQLVSKCCWLLSVSVMTPNCVTWMKGPRRIRRGRHWLHDQPVILSQGSLIIPGLWLVRTPWCSPLIGRLRSWCLDVLSLSLAVWLLFRSAGPSSDLKFKSSKHHLCGVLGETI